MPDALDDITVNVISIADFNSPVTLSFSEAPAGTTGSFSPNPVIPGNTSIASFSLPGSAPIGPGSFMINGTAAGADDRSIAVNLDVFNAPPAAAVLNTPADASIGVEQPVVLAWAGASQSAEFFIELALDSEFTNVIYTATEMAESHVVGIVLNPVTTYFWRVTASNICDPGATSEVFSFQTADIPPVLLVDDDDNSADVRPFFEASLNSLGIQFDVFDTNNSDDEPGADTLALYDAVVWFTGDEFGGVAGPDAESEALLGDFLDDGGCLLISSQDYFFDRGLTPFMTDFLGISAATSDTGDYTSVTGSGTLFAGLGPLDLDYGAAGISDFSDIFEIDGTAELAFDGDNDNDAASARPEFNAAFLGFPFPAIASAGDRDAVMQAFFDNCDLGSSLPEEFFIDGFEALPVR